ncbi:arginase family protein [Microbacterium sp. MPKO10]|uniref:arginase family protein n=1 Tax=Microbacterium sp. MPKO10 TaxID=2989818 RepID=UPI00223557B5|nr:arginase family protein [Microbacterium sp. MPKO10]MCW4458397.1 arginase family protein [Microbacterium sp. MPKO10]
MTAFMVVPQWQGSSSSRAMQLIDGAEAIRGDLPSRATTDIEVPAGAGDALDTGISRFTSLVTVRERLREQLSATTDTAVSIGGGCGIEVAAIDQAMERTDEDLAVLWLDAHPDLHTPESSPTGAFDGMALRAVLGEGHDVLAASHPIDQERIVLGGIRSVDPAEAEYLDTSELRALNADETDRIVDALTDTGASQVYVHIDLDVLDPADIGGTHWAEPFGIPLSQLGDLIGRVRNAFALAGAGITGFAPASPAAATDDLPAILRVLSALTRR